MNTKLTATIAIAVVAMMVFSTAGATTLSWFTDTEETDITITTGKLDVATSKFHVDLPVVTDYESEVVPNEFAIVYDDSRDGNTEWKEENDILSIAGNPDEVNVVISYDVTFSGDIDYRYFVGVNHTYELGIEVIVKDASGKEVKVGTWIENDPQNDMPFTFTHHVEMKINSLPEDLGKGTEGFIKIVNKITQYLDSSDPPFLDTWDTTADTSWYYGNEDKTIYALKTAEEFSGLIELVDSGNTLEGKTIRLDSDLDLDGKLFEPIGSYRKNLSFKGTFDGQGHTISNISQNTWELDNGYYYGDLGIGLFGKVENATIKNLNIDGASLSGESAICGTVAATAYGNCTFENITISNSNVADYQYYAGGIVGWASGDHVYKNIYIDSTTTIASQWGDFGNAIGGIIGGSGASATIRMEDCTVACRIDATNDVVSAYQWYAYRNCGMLIGTTNHTETDEAVTNAAAPNLTCKNVTVIYGEWANYHYCEFAGTGYPYVRCEAGISVDAYSNVRYGHPTDANGNEVVDDNHVHNEGEDHMKLVVFDQLFGGPAEHRYCTYGVAEHDGVTVIYNNK